MKYFLKIPGLICLVGILNTGAAAQSVQESEMEAKLALEQLLRAWNSLANAADALLTRIATFARAGILFSVSNITGSSF